MSEEERALLEEMRQHEQALKQDLDAQEAELRAQQQLLQEQEGERSRLTSELEGLQEQVRQILSANAGLPSAHPPTGGPAMRVTAGIVTDMLSYLQCAVWHWSQGIS